MRFVGERAPDGICGLGRRKRRMEKELNAGQGICMRRELIVNQHVAYIDSQELNDPPCLHHFRRTPPTTTSTTPA